MYQEKPGPAEASGGGGTGRAPGDGAQLLDWWRGLPPNLVGSLYTVASFASMTVLSVFVKMLAERIPVIEILFVRQGIGLVILLLLGSRNLRAMVTTDQLRMQVGRGLITLGGLSLGFYALAFLPLADSNALGFAEVLFTTLGAVVVLRETVGVRRWVATGVGFAGVLMMLSPFGSGVSLLTLFAVIAPAFGAAAAIMVRLMPPTETVQRILFWQTAISTTGFLVPAVILWVPMTWTEFGLATLVGIFALISQWFYTRAFQIGQASALAPMHFTRLIMAATAGWLAFGELPNAATMAGALLVVGATVYTLKRNAVRNVLVAQPRDPRDPP